MHCRWLLLLALGLLIAGAKLQPARYAARPGQGSSPTSWQHECRHPSPRAQLGTHSSRLQSGAHPAACVCLCLHNSSSDIPCTGRRCPHLHIHGCSHPAGPPAPLAMMPPAGPARAAAADTGKCVEDEEYADSFVTGCKRCSKDKSKCLECWDYYGVSEWRAAGVGRERCRSMPECLRHMPPPCPPSRCPRPQTVRRPPLPAFAAAVQQRHLPEVRRDWQLRRQVHHLRRR